MKKQLLVTNTLLLSLFLSSCSRDYSKGEEQLTYGNFQEAVPYLEEAVRLSPETARNHAALSYAYLMTGEMEKGWREARESLLCKNPKEISFFSFLNLYENLDMKYKFSKGGLTEEEILNLLGQPDRIEENSQEAKKTWVYGLAKLTFKDKVVTSSECKLENHENFEKVFKY